MMNRLIVSNLEKLLEDSKRKINLVPAYDKKEFEHQKRRIIAFNKAINTIKKHVEEIKSGKEALKLPGIGKGIADRIDEILRDNKLKELEGTSISSDNKRINNIIEFTSIFGIGPIKAKKYADEFNNVNDFINAVNDGNIKVDNKIKLGIKYRNDFIKKIPRKLIEEYEIKFKKKLKEFDSNLNIEFVGSYRRKKEYSGDIDILLSYMQHKNKHSLKEIIAFLVEQKLIADSLTTDGNKKFMGITVLGGIGRRIDILLIDHENFYAALSYFTGSKYHNILLRKTALDNDMVLNEYGLYDKDGKKFKLDSERDIYRILNISYLEPELR